MSRRAASITSSVSSATASGWLRRMPSDLLRRAISAAVKMVRRSISVGVRFIGDLRSGGEHADVARRSAGHGDVDQRGETRGLGVFVWLVCEQRFKHGAGGGERLLRLDMADGAETDGGADEAGDEGPAGEQLRRVEVEPSIAKGERLDDGEMT